MIFSPPVWLLGVCMTLESLRRGFVGGSALSLFIIKEFGLDKQAVPTLDWMRRYVDMEGLLLSQIPPIFNVLVMPFTDYHLASVNYLQTLEELAELQRPDACQFYWDKEDA